MVRAGNAELVDLFEEFFQNYYDTEIKELAQQYPNEQRSLYVDWEDIYRFDPDLADDFLNQPEQLQRYAEEALRLYELPVDTSLGQAHVRVHNLPEADTSEIRELGARHANNLVSISGRVKNASDVDLKMEEAAFECQLCGTLTRVPQSSSDFQEPHECQGCERQAPYRVNYDQSEFVDAQDVLLVDFAAPSSAPPGEIQVHIEDDIAGNLQHGQAVEVVGIPRLEQREDTEETRFDYFFEGMTVSQLEVDLELYPDEYLVDRSDLEDFVHRSRAVINRHDTLSETNAKAKLITPFVSVLGWDVFGSEVQLEYEDDDLKDRVDYALLDEDGSPRVVVEAKGMNKVLDSTQRLSQVKGYMRTFGSDWGVLTNGERYIVLRSEEDSPTPSETRVLDCEVEALLSHDEIVSAISRDAHID